MVVFKINGAKTFLPLKVARGTAERRLERARELNDKFYNTLTSSFTDGVITKTKFIRQIQKTAGTHFRIIYRDSYQDTTKNVTHLVDETATCMGYNFTFRKNINLDNKLKDNNIMKLLNISLQYFHEILSPKFFRREITMLNKGMDVDTINNFFVNRIDVKGKLDKKALKQFLKPFSTDDKIDTLQLFRYNLIKAKSNDVYKKHYMRIVNNTPRLGIQYSEKAITSDAYMYDEKLQIIEQELAKTLKKARSKK